MPRWGRLHIPGGCYHVMGRGLERRNIFSTIDDKEDFLNRIGAALERNDACCLAWAVMSNHYHLLLKVGANPLSQLMAPLLTGYAINYNLRHNRVGYVFQSRFRSILCDEQEYLLRLLRYIHFNPWKAGMLSDREALDDYRYTGHAGSLGKHVQAWHAIDRVLHLFSDNRKDAVSGYRTYILEGMNMPAAVNFSGGGLIRSYGGWESLKNMRCEHEQRIGDERILGKTDFVESILKDDILGLDKQESTDWDISQLAKAVCYYYDVSEVMLSVRSRMNNVSKARQLFAYFAITKLRTSSAKLEGHLKVGQSGISKLVQKGRQICIKDNILLSCLMKGKEP